MSDLTPPELADLENRVAILEGSSAIWRLESASRSSRLVEERAVGGDVDTALRAAQEALNGVSGEIEKVQQMARDHAGMPYQLTLRLVEVGVDLETAKRRLSRALRSPAEADEATPLLLQQ